MGQLTLLGSHGDERVKWDPSSDDEVNKAREKFDELIKRGWLAFRLETRREEIPAPPKGLLRRFFDAMCGRQSEPGKPTVTETQVKGAQITSFDRDAGEILMVRPLRGG